MAKKNDINKSALKVNKGIEQPSQINEEAVKNISKRTKHHLKTDDYIKGIFEGNMTILSRAITLIESSLIEHQKIAQQIIEKCLPHSGKSLRIGITGVPGVGKSTFIEALGKQLTAKGHKLAVLAIDPSSERTKGSVLGDKTRMEELAVDKNAFIRPSPSAGSLGGVARKTKETIILCEAAGFDIIFIETVGVGQSEISVHSMVDFFLLLMLAGAGDELQGIKRGIIEMADAIIINKAENDNLLKAQIAKRQYKNALHLYPPAVSGWTPVVDTCSAISNDRILNVWEVIKKYIAFTKANGYFEKNRRDQSVKIMFESINESLMASFYSDKDLKKILVEYEKDLLENKLSSYVAAQKLLEIYFNKKKL